jgi:Male sterility protein
VNFNFLGTLEIVKLAKKLKLLKAFVYVSTSFSTPYFNTKEKCKLKV